MVSIYRQKVLKEISLFTPQPKAKFYDELFINLDLSCIPANNSKLGRASYSNHAMIYACIVMKCEVFSQMSLLSIAITAVITKKVFLIAAQNL